MVAVPTFFWANLNPFFFVESLRRRWSHCDAPSQWRSHRPTPVTFRFLAARALKILRKHLNLGMATFCEVLNCSIAPNHFENPVSLIIVPISSNSKGSWPFWWGSLDVGRKLHSPWNASSRNPTGWVRYTEKPQAVKRSTTANPTKLYPSNFMSHV